MADEMTPERWLEGWGRLFAESFERGFVQHLDPNAYCAQLYLDPYCPCTCGVPADDPRAADSDCHAPDCQYRNPTS